MVVSPAPSLAAAGASLPPLRIAIMANEPSGDLLGAGLMRGLKRRYPQVEFEGVGGSEMAAEGLVSLFPLERLSVMGLVEVLRHLPDLLSIRRQLLRRFIAKPPHLFIGIDAPDFNLPLGRRLKAAAIPCVHYVCPSVWAWRPKRVNKLRAACDLVLCIFPFEPGFLAEHGVRGLFVGHTLAEAIPDQPDQAAARHQLGLEPDAKVLALLPGSRISEVARLAGPFLKTAHLCQQHIPELRVVIPLVNPSIAQYFASHFTQAAEGLSLTLVPGHARTPLTAADVVITASGTATLEALLLRKPMVVGYRLNALTYWLVKTFNLVKVKHVAIANLLAGREIVPEFIQQALQPGPMAERLCEWLQNPAKAAEIRAEAGRIHQLMRRQADDRAAEAVLQLLEDLQPRKIP